jgi:hypothetical protein
VDSASDQLSRAGKQNRLFSSGKDLLIKNRSAVTYTIRVIVDFRFIRSDTVDDLATSDDETTSLRIATTGRLIDAHIRSGVGVGSARHCFSRIEEICVVGNFVVPIQASEWGNEPSQPGKREFCATNAEPGSPEKLEILARRIQSGLPLWHPNDRHAADVQGLDAVDDDDDYHTRVGCP